MVSSPCTLGFLCLCMLALLLNGINVKGEEFSSAVLSTSQGYTLKWWFGGDEVVIQASFEGKAWIGIGWHCVKDNSSTPSPWCGASDPQMVNSDIVVATFDDAGNVISVNDMYATGNGRPTIDSASKNNCTNDLLQYSGFQTSSFTFLEFRRKLVTNDTLCDHPIIKGNMNFIWARGSSNNFGYHGSVNRGLTQVNLLSGAIKQPVDYAGWHGALMILSWAISISFGIFSARFLKSNSWWFPLHIFTQMFGLLGAAAAFGIALYMSKGNHFGTVHSYFGLSVLILGALGAVLGVLSHCMWDSNRYGVPVWPDKVHWWVGRLAVVLSYVTIILGMRVYGLPNLLVIVFSLVVALYLFIYCFVSLKHNSNYKPLN